jgi:hypothetical protein
VLKHFLPITAQVLAVDNWQVHIFVAEQISQHLLAFELGRLPKVVVTPKEIEGVVDEPILFTRGEFGLEFGEIGSALMNDDHLTIDDGLAGNIEGAGNE